MKNDPDPLQEPRFEKLVAELRAQPAPEPSAGFTERTLARARQAPPRPRTGWHALPRIAAALALLGAAGWWLARGPAPVARAPAPVDILMAAQRDDGGWSADDQNRRARYDTSVTDATTPVDRVFEIRAGVCQDLAHVAIAAMRSIGLPARYVSGYLLTQPPPGRMQAGCTRIPV